MSDNKIEINLPNVDDLFKIGNNTERVIRVNIQEISDFPNHPYKVKDDEEMLNMVETIKQKGVILPVIVRQKEDGSYEMISRTQKKKSK